MTKSGTRKDPKKVANQAAETRDVEEFSESDSDSALPLLEKSAKEGDHLMRAGSAGPCGGMRSSVTGLFLVVLCLAAGCHYHRRNGRAVAEELRQLSAVKMHPLRHLGEKLKKD